MGLRTSNTLSTTSIYCIDLSWNGSQYLISSFAKIARRLKLLKVYILGMVDLTYLTYSCLLLREHRATTTPRHGVLPSDIKNMAEATDWILVLIVFVTFQVSEPYNRTDFT